MCSRAPGNPGALRRFRGFAAVRQQIVRFLLISSGGLCWVGSESSVLEDRFVAAIRIVTTVNRVL